MSKLTINAKIVTPSEPSIDLPDLDITIIEVGETQDIDLELVWLEGGPVLRPRNPPM